MICLQPSRGTLLTGVLGMVLWGCSGSESDGSGDADPTTGSQSSTETSSLTSGASAPSTTATTGGASMTLSATATTNGDGTTGLVGTTTTDGGGGSTGASNDAGTAAGTGGAGMTSTTGTSASADSGSGGNPVSTTTTNSTATDGVAGADNPGACTASQPANSNASGSGPHDVVVETNSDPGIAEGTIFRPADLGGTERYPIFVWGEGGCSQNGLSNASAMAEIASHGYFVVADGTPNGSGSRPMDSNDVPSMGEPLLAYIEWAIAENTKPCSAYYHSLDTAKVSANGFSCGGLMSEGTAGDPRITTWGLTSSGMFSVNQAFYDTIHTPVLLVEGGPSDIAYENGQRDYENISPLGLPIMWFSKDLGHGGDLFQGGGGDFTKIILAWLNWWLKGDETATGKGALVGAGCSYCSDSAWEVKSANLP